MIDAKDRGQLLRMAGNIACGLVTQHPDESLEAIARDSALLALMTMKEVDKLIVKENENHG